mgnify:CR=1 FL=1
MARLIFAVLLALGLTALDQAQGMAESLKSEFHKESELGAKGAGEAGTAAAYITQRQRADGAKGFEIATDDMIKNLKTQLEAFRERVKTAPAGSVARIEHKPGYTGGGSFGEVVGTVLVGDGTDRRAQFLVFGRLEEVQFSSPACRGCRCAGSARIRRDPWPEGRSWCRTPPPGRDNRR